MGIRRTGGRQPSTEQADDAVVTELVGWLGTGARVAEARVFSLYGKSEPRFQTRLLDGIALAAAQDCPFALSVLLAIVDEHRLAGPAVANAGAPTAHRQDIEQGVLIAIARSIHRFRGDARFTTWLHSVARNVTRSETRRLKPTVGLDHVDGHRAPNRSPERRLSSLVAEERLIESVIEQLPSPFRETVYLRDIDRLSYIQIADRQQISVNTVKSRLSRGRLLLARIWDEAHSPQPRPGSGVT